MTWIVLNSLMDSLTRKEFDSEANAIEYATTWAKSNPDKWFYVAKITHDLRASLNPTVAITLCK